jgi:hypothetical protein
MDCLELLVLKEIEVLMVHQDYMVFQDRKVNRALQGSQAWMEHQVYQD